MREIALCRRRSGVAGHCMACALNLSRTVKRTIVVAIALALAGCRGEPVPRDYQNHPPAMTHSPKKKAESPSAQGMPPALPEPSTGVEGSGSPYTPVTPPTGTGATTGTLKDLPPVTRT